MIGYVAVFTSLGVIGRIAFTILPNIAPVAPLTLLSGYLGGPLSGFLVGMLTMVVSDLYIGFGPWTIFTSFFMGVVGVFGAVVRRYMVDRVSIFIASYLAVLLYDIGTSVFTVIWFGVDPLISILNLFVPIFFLGIPYPMGPVHEFTSSLMFLLLVEALSKFGYTEVAIVGGEAI